MHQKDTWIIILLWTLSSLGTTIGSSLIVITSAWTGHLGQGISCCCCSLYLLSLLCLSNALTYTWHHRHTLFTHHTKHPKHVENVVTSSHEKPLSTPKKHLYNEDV
ncbi:MAG: hypothetical protein J5965_16575 [Aeriscardovia sp.]|nr:hypothetical protein [Aeriscardovia sp.]